MTEKEKLQKALESFRKQYPMTTSADLQTFVMGWNARIECCEKSNIVTNTEQKT